MEVNEIISKMKPEHAEVIQGAINSVSEELAKAKEDLATVTAERDTANEDLAKAKEELETLRAEGNDDGKDDGKDGAEKAKSGSAFDETETLKSMPQEVREMFAKMKAQKEAAEEEIRKAKEEKETAEAIAKAKELKAIPVEQDKLVDIIKGANADLLDLLSVVNAAIEGTVLDEVGKSNAQKSDNGADAWAQIEAKADEVAKRDSVSKQKAISIVIKEEPNLYKEYLQGGAN